LSVRRPGAHDDRQGEAEEVPLSQTATFILEECRMVLPGIQALFGFQLIAVFSERFAGLARLEQWFHLSALFLIALAMALIMGPAAYQRHAEPEMVTHRFVRLATRLVLLSMFPFTAGISLDFYVIAQLVLGHRLLGAIFAAALFGWFFTVWFILPRARKLRDVFTRTGGPLVNPRSGARRGSLPT
jgi:hypothetical protein